MQDDPLTQTLFLNYQRAGKEAGYWARYFRRELDRHGGLYVAQKLLAKKTLGGESAGFLALAEANLPELSVEHVVLLPEFRHLFSQRELAVAKERLRRFPILTQEQTTKQIVFGNQSRETNAQRAFVTSRSFPLPIDAREMSQAFWFNMWQNRCWPYDAVKVGDTLYWHDPKRKSIVWQSRIVKVDRFKYETKVEVEKRLRKSFCNPPQKQDH